MILRKKKIKIQADTVYESIYKRLTEREKSFYRDFFECAADMLYADLHDYFFDMRFLSNVFKRGVFRPNGMIFERFFKIMGSFYAINFLSVKIDGIEENLLTDTLFYAFGFDDSEKRLHRIMKKIAENHKRDFLNVFVYALKRYVLFMDEENYFYLAFSANFCYNSYKTFCELFTRYESIEYRMNKYIS